jgi:hypothetical protein
LPGRSSSTFCPIPWRCRWDFEPTEGLHPRTLSRSRRVELSGVLHVRSAVHRVAGCVTDSGERRRLRLKLRLGARSPDHQLPKTHGSRFLGQTSGLESPDDWNQHVVPLKIWHANGTARLVRCAPVALLIADHPSGHPAPVPVVSEPRVTPPRKGQPPARFRLSSESARPQAVLMQYARLAASACLGRWVIKADRSAGRPRARRRVIADREPGADRLRRLRDRRLSMSIPPCGAGRGRSSLRSPPDDAMSAL